MTRIQSPAEAKIIPLACAPRPTLEAHPASYPMDARGPFPGGKVRPLTTHPESSAEVKNEEQIVACMVVAGQL
jgi:hypothetical protein